MLFFNRICDVWDEEHEAMVEQYGEVGLLNSVEFLEQLLEIARGKAALTELFEAVRNPETLVIVERVVADIDQIVRLRRFPGWQQTAAGEREVKQALRKTRFKYRLHRDAELFDTAYGYIRQYY
jgi:type I restriction enzyme R subunit